MRCPWVSRYTHTALLDACEARAVRAEGALQELEQRYRDLVDKYTAKADPPKPTPKIKDLVADAVRTRAGTNGALRAHLGQYARTCRADELPDEDIIAAIMHWDAPDDEGVE